MRREHKVLIAAIIAGVATVGAVGVAYASCWFYQEIEEWELELVDVSIDGESVEELDEYQEVDLKLTSTLDRGGQFSGPPVALVVEEEGEDSYDVKQLIFDEGSLPLRWEPYSSWEDE